MNIVIPKWLAPWLIGLGLAGFVLALIVTIRAYTQLRRGEYYVIREDARRRALWASLLSFGFIVVTVGALFIPRQESVPEPTPTATLTPSPSPTPTTPVPTSEPTASATATPQPTATEPFIPTLTPQATLPITFTTPFPSAVPPPGDARFEFWTLAAGVDENDQPVEPASEFSTATERVYLFFRFDGLLPDIPWTTVWYINGKVLSGGTNLWEPERPTGFRHVFLEFAGGFPAGAYEVQLWLDDRLQIRAEFSIVQAD
jgi:hypothetical protein